MSPQNSPPRRKRSAGAGHRDRAVTKDEEKYQNSPAGRRRARRDENHAKKRREILDVAGRHFLDHGYAATTMSAIASEMGGSKTTLWDHFPSKQELLEAFLLDATSAICEINLRDLAVEFSPFEAIQVFAEHIIERLTTERAIGLQRLVYRLFKAIRPDLTAFFDAHLDSDSRRSGDADAAAAMLLTLCLNLGQERLLWAVEQPYDGLAKERAALVARLMHVYPMKEGPRRSS